MELITLGGIYLLILLILYIFGVPVALAMGISTLFIILLPQSPELNINVIANQMLWGINSFSLLALPFYILLGRLMNALGLTDEIFDFANSLVGQFRGGIAYVNVLASMIFSGMSGLASADAAGLGRVEYRAMMNQGYDQKITLGVTGASSVIGPIIPPSVTLIVYGVLAEESIGDLFLAGIIPGIILGLSIMTLVFLMARRNNYTADRIFNFGDVVSNFKSAFPALLVPFIVIFGIIGGVFTATEAGAVAVVYSAIIGLVYGNLNIKTLHRELKESMIETFSLTIILALASLYGLVALQLRIPMVLTELMTSLSDDPLTILLIIVVLLLIVGTFLETIAAISILLPILMPTLLRLNIDLVHFGIIMVLTLMLGLLTPPFGLVLFILEKVTPADIGDVIKAVIPFYIPIILTILLIIIFPRLATYIPSQI